MSWNQKLQISKQKYWLINTRIPLTQVSVNQAKSSSFQGPDPEKTPNIRFHLWAIVVYPKWIWWWISLPHSISASCYCHCDGGGMFMILLYPTNSFNVHKPVSVHIQSEGLKWLKILHEENNNVFWRNVQSEQCCTSISEELKCHEELQSIPLSGLEKTNVQMSVNNYGETAFQQLFCKPSPK